MNEVRSQSRPTGHCAFTADRVGGAQSRAPHGLPDQAPTLRFVETALGSGLDFVVENFSSPTKHMIEPMTGGVAVFDYDNDGSFDIYFANGAVIPSLKKEDPKYYNRLYRNLGDLRFQDVTGAAGVSGEGYSMGVAAGDYGNDGNIDLFVAGVFHNLLFRNLGNGRFEEVTQAAGINSDLWSVAAGWFDYDRDGLLDLFVVNYVVWSPTGERFCGDKSRKLRVYCHPKHFTGVQNQLYRNRGDGTFENVTERSGVGRYPSRGMSVAFEDFDGDGDLDAFVTNDNLPNSLFQNQGDGSFLEVGLLGGVALRDNGRPVSSMGVDFRDYDNDGRPDLAVTALAGETFPLFRNIGGGMFEDATYSSQVARESIKLSAWSNALVDFDNDGWKDIFTANSHVNDLIEQFESSVYKQPNSLFWNLGNGTFREISSLLGEGFQKARAHRGSAFGDFDEDGRIDLVVTSIEDQTELFHNRSANSHHWIRLKLRGTTSNRDGIGARVTVDGQYNMMTTASGYASSSHSGVHFGLGMTRRIHQIRIRWPSGIEQVLENVEVDQVLEVVEPEN